MAVAEAETRPERHWSLLAVVAVAAALALRAFLVHGENEDTAVFATWLDYLQENGVGEFLRHEFRTNYPPLYLYQLVLGDLVLPTDLLVMKVVPIACDVLCAALAWKIVRLRHPVGPAPLAAFVAVLFAPTVVLNSAYWGQIDSMWTAGLLACVYFLLRRRETAALLSFGLALAVKVQAVFLLPLLVALALRGRIRWRAFLLVPVPYLLLCIPAVLAGRSFPDLLTLYRDQAGYFGELTLNAPNPYAWIPERFSGRLADPATGIALVVLAGLTLLAARRPRRLDDDALVGMATFSVLVAPFVLPHMHERYFFAADVFTVVLAFHRPRWALVAVAVQVTSLLAYWPFLFLYDALPLALLAAVESLAVIGLAALLVRMAREPRAAA
jgi:Gpi18-like mannosyltransferase